MPTNEPLEDRIAWTYPNDYNPDTWVEKLLPRYIEDELEKYSQTIKNYDEHVATWRQEDPSVTAPDAPIPPSMLLQACDIYAKQSGFRYELLAFSLFSIERQARRFKKALDWTKTERDYYKQLWDESEEGKESVRMSEQGTSVE